MEKVIVDCLSVKDEHGRTIPPTTQFSTLTAPEETAYETRRQAGEAVHTASAIVEAQRATDLATICAAGALPGGSTFAALCRLMGGTV
jgi:hypothetical protein